MAFYALRMAGAMLLGSVVVSTIAGEHTASTWFTIALAYLCSFVAIAVGSMEDKYKRIK